MRKRFQTLGAMLIALAITWPAAAQEQRAAIEGTVKDSTGGVIPGASIEAKSVSGTITTVSDSTGKYRFPALKPGKWAVTARLSGFGPATVQNVDLSLGDTLKVDLTLGPVSVAEAVTVRGEAPLIDTKSSARFVTITAEQINRLPKGRDYSTLVTQAPGANNESKGAGISIDGATAAENKYIIDGVETSNIIGGMQGKTLVTDLVEEIQVKSSGYAAEYGGSTGGVINVLTKSGTNMLKGDVGVYYSGSGTGFALGPPLGATAVPAYADGRQSLRLDPNASGLVAQYVTYNKDTYSQWEPGFTLGGPIAQDKLWFFAAYQPSIISRERTATQSGGGIVTKTQDTKIQYASANLTSQMSNSTRLRLAFNNSSSKQEGILPALLGNDPVTANYGINTARPNWTGSLNLDVVASSNVYFGLRGGYFTSDTHQTGVPNVPRYVFQASNIGFLDVPASLQHGAGFASVPTNSAVSFDTQTRLSGQFDSTFYFQAGGDHAVKLGVQYDRLGDNVQSGEQKNRINIFWNRQLVASNPASRGAYGYYTVRGTGPDPKHGFGTVGQVNVNNIGLFLQDTWTIANRLTLNIGLRTENEHWPNFADANGNPTSSTALTFGFGDKLAPRLGFAWDPAGDNKTKVYGSWGYFYDIIKLNMPRGSFGGDKWLEWYYTLDTFNWNTLTDAPACPPTCPGTLLRGPINFRLPSNIPGSDPPGIDPNIKPFKLQEYTFGVERELNPVMSVSARYVHKDIITAIEDLGFLDAKFNEVYTEGNPGFGLNAVCGSPANGSATKIVACAKAVRKYDAVEMAYNKRYADNWALRFSYTWSRLFGNYSGNVNSDENGRDNPNNNRNFDFPFMAFGQDGKPVYGVLPTDRTHQFKAQAIYTLPFGTTFGLGGYFASGIPITREAAFITGSNYPVQYAGRNSDGRTPWFSQFDVNLGQDIHMGPVTMTLTVNVLNVFNQHIATNKFNTQLAAGQAICVAAPYNCSSFEADSKAFYNGFDAGALIAAQHLVTDPRFLKASEYQNPRTVRFGARFAF
ncbi:MAG: carboxypeptidase regulatory-like domain-containing protein [Thermoanaerobaculia bacterium]